MSSSFLSTSAGNVSGSILAAIGKPLELLDGPTHRGLHRFVPRHPDEIEIDIGDPVYVQREAEDLWCEGNKSQTKQFHKAASEAVKRGSKDIEACKWLFCIES